MSKLILFSLLSLSLLFCDDNEGYIFELNLNNDFYMDLESVVEFSQGQYDHYMMFSSRMLHEFEKPNPSTGEIIMMASFENVISSNRRNDEMRPDHDAQKLTGTSYKHTIDSLGYIASVVGNSDLAQEVIEESNEVNWLFGVNTDRNNIKYFLGGDTLRRVGDVWTSADSTSHIEDTYGFDKFEGSATTNVVYSFKKIKEKRGNIIAVVESNIVIEVTGVGSSWENTVEFTQTGEFKCDMLFNITKGIIISNKMNGALAIKGKDLDNDSSWNATISVALKQKGKLK